jgi:Uma2 family endonuclease
MDMASPALRQEQKYTYKDYLGWPDDERWEIIEGVAYDMSPAPTATHQLILGELHGLFRTFLKDKTRTVILAPFDVRLPDHGEKDEDIATVVQPDLSVICDKSKIDERGAKGAPDLAIEITSPGTAGKDMKQKLALYEKHGVREYWIVHAIEKVVEIFSPNDQGKYGKPDVYTEKDKIDVKLFPGLVVDLASVFSGQKE